MSLKTPQIPMTSERELHVDVHVQRIQVPAPKKFMGYKI